MKRSGNIFGSRNFFNQIMPILGTLVTLIWSRMALSLNNKYINRVHKLQWSNTPSVQLIQLLFYVRCSLSLSLVAHLRLCLFVSLIISFQSSIHISFSDHYIECPMSLCLRDMPVRSSKLHRIRHDNNEGEKNEKWKINKKYASRDWSLIIIIHVQARR